MSTYTNMHGIIRLYDSTDDLRSLAGGDVEVYDDDPAGSFTDKTSEARADDASLTGDFCVAASDALYVGHTLPFARIKVALDTEAVAAGALIVKYYDGDTWEVVAATDGTSDGTDTLTKDGVISFKPPQDWAPGGNAGLSSTKYYIQLTTTDVPSTAPDADQVWPVDGQYFDLVFDEGNLSAPEGRARPEETVVLHRGRIDSNAHYVMGADTPVAEPLELSFSVRLDTTINATALVLALTCGNADSGTTWDADGVSTKTDTDLTSGGGSLISSPAFEDASYKTVCVEALWTRDGVSIGRAYHEVFFSPDQISTAESEEGVILSVTGMIYGLIEPIFHLAYQY